MEDRVTVSHVRPLSEITYAVSTFAVLRYKIIGSLYLIFITFGLFVLMLAATAIILGVPWLVAVSSKLNQLLAIGIGSGGSGSWLWRLDLKEQENLRYQQTLCLIQELPAGKQRDKAIVDYLHVQANKRRLA